MRKLKKIVKEYRAKSFYKVSRQKSLALQRRRENEELIIETYDYYHDNFIYNAF